MFHDGNAEMAAAAGAVAVDGNEPEGTTVLLVLPERDDAERIAGELAAQGWSPAQVHREMLAGEDDAEAVDWVVELVTAPDGRPASTLRCWLDVLAEDHEGFTSDHG